MERTLEECFEQISRISHYHGFDYSRLREQLGDGFLCKRLNGQLNLYATHRTGQGEGGLQKRRMLMRTLVHLGLAGTGLLKRARSNARRPQVVERDVVLNHLPPSFDGYRILHLSDFHFEFIPELPEILKGILKDLSFDMCCLTGDFRGETTGPYEESLLHLDSCRGVLGDAVVTVLGNHDNVELLPKLQDLNITCLMNDVHHVTRGTDSLLIAGVDDPHYYKTHRLDVVKSALQPETPSILLSHSPGICMEAARAGFDLMLCGHTHGGQLCLPGGIPVLSHAGEAPRCCIRGDWVVNGLQGYTSRGIGCSSMDVRLNCLPEVTVHTLRS